MRRHDTLRSLFLCLSLLGPLCACKEEAKPPVKVAVAAPAPEAPPAPRGPPLGEVAKPKAEVTEALVERYLEYRRAVVNLGREVVEEVVQTRAEAEAKRDAGAPKQAGSVRAKRATEGFVERMKAVEEKARKEAGLSVEEIEAVGQVAAAVLAARQTWKRTGGDEAVQQAKAKLATLKGEARKVAEARFVERARGYRKMRDAQGARDLFGDPAVDAVLAHEDALWAVQQEGARVMAAIY